MGGDDKQRGRVTFLAFPLDINGTRFSAFVISYNRIFEILNKLLTGDIY